MPVELLPGIAIPDGELTVEAIRSSGPGGQNVNKVASAVQLRYALGTSSVLPERVKARLRTLAGWRMTDEGSLLIVARTHRSQEQNRREALERLADLIRRALVEPKIRRPTKPTRGSKERRLAGKQRRGATKQLRGRRGLEE
jgi:ribosome-associated protein